MNLDALLLIPVLLSVGFVVDLFYNDGNGVSKIIKSFKKENTNENVLSQISDIESDLSDLYDDLYDATDEDEKAILKEKITMKTKVLEILYLNLTK